MGDFGAYLAIITAIVAAYLAYINQLKLKTFELFFERRKSVLDDIEKFLADLYDLQFDLQSESESGNRNKFEREYSHRGLILYHKVKGANYGEVSDVMINTFMSIINEPISEKNEMSLSEFKDWISRLTNVVSALYGFSHSQLTKDLEYMAFSPISRLTRKYRNRMKTEKMIKGKENKRKS